MRTRPRGTARSASCAAPKARAVFSTQSPRAEERTDLAARRDGARRLAPGVERVLALVVRRLLRRGVDARSDV